jgi:ribosomal protein S18 acetylase RimI-like enzyme
MKRRGGWLHTATRGWRMRMRRRGSGEEDGDVSASSGDDKQEEAEEEVCARARGGGDGGVDDVARLVAAGDAIGLRWESIGRPEDAMSVRRACDAVAAYRRHVAGRRESVGRNIPSTTAPKMHQEGDGALVRIGPPMCVGADFVAERPAMLGRLRRLCSGGGFDDFAERLVRSAVHLARMGRGRGDGLSVSSPLDGVTLVVTFAVQRLGSMAGVVLVDEIAGVSVVSTREEPAGVAEGLLEVACVDPDYRGAGFGAWLIEQTQRRFRRWAEVAAARLRREEGGNRDRDGPGDGGEWSGDEEGVGTAVGEGVTCLLWANPIAGKEGYYARLGFERPKGAVYKVC